MQKILLFGGSGLVGSRVLELLSNDFEFIAPTHLDLDLTNFKEVEKNINEVKPSLILYAAGFTNVDLAEEKKEECYLLNSKVVKVIAEFANSLRAPFYYLSTDYVFNGEKEDSSYSEEDEPDPLSNYGKSKREGEIATLSISSKNCVIRLIMPFRARYDKKLDIARLTLENLKKGEKMFGVIDQNINPVFVDDLSFAIGFILKKKAFGIYHIGATTYTTPEKFLKKIAQIFKLNENLIEGVSFKEFSKTKIAKRPKNSWLETSKFRSEFGEEILHSVDDGLNLFKEQLQS